MYAAHVCARPQLLPPCFMHAGTTASNPHPLHTTHSRSLEQPLLVNRSAMPNGIAWHNGSLWVASLEPFKSCRIYRLDNADRYALERRTAKPSDLVLVRGDLPFDFLHG